MKLLLTSGGLSNATIVNALSELVLRPFSDLKIAFLSTASNLESGDKRWLIKDLKKLDELGFSEIDILDIASLPKEIWLQRLNTADVIMVEGGNTYHLMYWLKKSGLADVLPELLKTKVYIGISAGTIVMTPSMLNAVDEKSLAAQVGENVSDDGLSFVNFMITPHINSPYFPEYTLEKLETESKKYSHPIYGLDNSSAIKIDDNLVEVVSEGVWKKFE